MKYDLSAVLLAVLVICGDSDVSDKRCFVCICHAVQQRLLSLGCLTLEDKVTRFLRNVGFTKRRGVTSRRYATPLILADYLLWQCLTLCYHQHRLQGQSVHI